MAPRAVATTQPPSSPSRRASYYYFSEAGSINIKSYSYSASDASLLYHYIFSPLAQWLVDHVLPPWLAPNLITLSGLSLVISSHLLMVWYSPNFGQDASLVVPSWVYAWSGLSLFMYQILDVADGKQARKTGNASPLGLLFDHGCDALNVIVSACTMATTLRFGPSYESLALLFFPSLVFFMATYEEFYTGTLALPLINGPNEGLAGMYGLYFLTALCGDAFWSAASGVATLQYNQLFLLLTSLSSLATVGCNVVNVMNHLRRHQASRGPALLGLLPYLALVALVMAWVVLSPINIVVVDTRLLIWTFGLLFCKLVMHIMLAHLCDEPVSLLRKTLMGFFTVAAAAVAGFVPTSSEVYVARAFCTVSCIAYIHMVYTLLMDLSTLLKIRVFHVKTSESAKSKTT